MKTSQPLPVEVLRVEDKITPFLSLKQFLCLLSSLAIAILFFFLLPPSGQLVFYKLYWLTLVFLTGLLLIIKVRQRLILEWLMIVVSYNLRPKVYLNQSLVAKSQRRES